MDLLTNSSAFAKAKRVRSVRMLAGLKRHEIQEKYGIHENTIKSWEKPSETSKGLTEKGAKRFLEVLAAEGVECSLPWLLNGQGEGPRIIYKGDIHFPEISVPEIEIDQDIAILKEVQFFLDINEDATVLLVNDSNMAPLYQIGDYVGGYTRVSSDIAQLINVDSIIEIEDGLKVLGRLMPGSDENRYRIVQINTTLGQGSKSDQYKIKSAAAVIWHRKKDLTSKTILSPNIVEKETDDE